MAIIASYAEFEILTQRPVAAAMRAYSWSSSFLPDSEKSFPARSVPTSLRPDIISLYGEKPVAEISCTAALLVDCAVARARTFRASEPYVLS